MDDLASASRLAPWGPPPALRPIPPALVSAVAETYAHVDAALAPLANSCRACGTCCRFERGGPVLFASALELAYLFERAGAPPGDRRPQPAVPDAPWTCPYQDADRCRARDGRALGCRTYFCDPAARTRGEAVYAKAAARLRRVAEAHGYPWWYGPARAAFERRGEGETT